MRTPLSFPPACFGGLGASFHLLGGRHSRSLPAGGMRCTTVPDDDVGRRCQGRPSVRLSVYLMRRGLSNVLSSLEDTRKKIEAIRPQYDAATFRSISKNENILFIQHDSTKKVLGLLKFYYRTHLVYDLKIFLWIFYGY